jgi:hypothetical protein
MSAIRNLSSGDIILIEIGIDIVNAEDEVIYNEMCVEVEDVTFHTIRLATALGICVIEGAGNSGANLDDFVHPIHRTRILDRSAGPTSGFRDSGAILVGASMPSQPYESHPRLIINNLGSNYGSRIDCFAWGRWVDTIGSSSDNPDNHYVTNFGGTSSASAIVAGAALSVQGINQSINGYRFSPLGLRMILSDQSINTHSENPSYDRIGVMPDLRRITNDLLELHSVDIYMRDNIDDTGDHSVGPLASSPDIILKTVEVMNPQEEFGEESIGVNSNTLSDQVNPGQDNFVYLRVRNRGMDDAFNTFAQVYWSPPATLPTPNLWHLRGTVNIANIPADNYLMVSNPVTWHSSDIPGAGHYCFIALIGNDLDPAPLLTEPPATDFMTWENYTTFVRNNNNVVWRNFNIVDNAPEESGFIPLDFLATGAPDRDLVMSLEVISKLPHGSKAFLMLGMRTARLFSLLLRRTNSIIPNNGNIMIPINIHGKFVIGDALFHKQVKIPLKILLYIPEKKHISTYTIYVRQLFEGDEVGRITWQLSKIEET